MTKKGFLKKLRNAANIEYDSDSREKIAGIGVLGWILGSGLLLGTRFRGIGWIISTVSGMFMFSAVSDLYQDVLVSYVENELPDSFDPEEDE